MLKEGASILQAIIPVLILDINDGIAGDIENMLAQYSNEFEISKHNSIENSIQLLHQNQQIITILFTVDRFDLTASTNLAMVTKTFPEKNIIIIAKEACTEHGLEALKLGAKDYLFYSELTPNNLGRILQYAEQRSQIQQKNQKNY